MVEMLPRYRKLIVFLLWLGLAALTVFLHEPWRDEVHSWTIARMSDSPAAVIQARAYEGHPSLWYLILWGLTRFTDTPAGMQVLHLLIAAGCAALLIWKAPFPFRDRALLVLGYFFLFEYTVLARNYALGIFFLLLFCALFPQRGKRWGFPLLTLLLWPVLESNVLGLMSAMALFGFLLLEHMRSWKTEKPGLWPLLSGSLLFLMMLTVALLDILPPANSGVGTKWHLGLSYEGLTYALSTIWDALLPLPRLQLHFWNSNFLYVENETLMLSLKSAGALLLFFAATRFWLRHPLIRLLFLTGAAMYLAFFYTKYHGFLRHHGHLFVWLIICRWLDVYLAGKGKKEASWVHFLRGPAFTGLLGLHLLAGLIACQYDWRYPFSGAQAATAWLRAQDLTESPMLGDPDFVAGGVSGRLGRAMYFPMTGGEGIYPVWDQQRRWRPPAEVWQAAQALSDRSAQPVILVLNYPLAEKVKAPGLRLLKAFTGNIESSEDIFIYESGKK